MYVCVCVCESVGVCGGVVYVTFETECFVLVITLLWFGNAALPCLHVQII